MAVDCIADASSIRCNKSDLNSLWGRGIISGKEVILAKPQTFMNLSGVAVKSIADYFKIKPKDIVVVYDDVDLGSGSVRIRARGGSGGHKGIESIIKELGTNAFPRIRLGIGRPKKQMQDARSKMQEGDIADYVLTSFDSEEKDMLKQILERTKEAVGVMLKDGVEKAMNRFNKKAD